MWTMSSIWGLWQCPFYHYPNALIIFEGYGSGPSTTIPMLSSSLRAMAVSLLPLSQCSHHLWGLWQWPFYHYPNALITFEGYGSGPSTTIPMLSSSLKAMAVSLLPLYQCSHHLWGLWQCPFYHYPNALIIFEGYGSVPSNTIPMLSSSLRAMAVALLPLSQCSHHLWGLWQCPFYHYPNALIIFEGYGSVPSTTIPMLLSSLRAMAVSLLPLSQCSHHLWGLWQWPFYHYPNALIIFEGYGSGPSTTIPMLSSSLRAMAVALLPLSQCSHHLWGLWQWPFYHYPNALIIFEGYGSGPSTTIPMLSSSLRAMAVSLLPLSQCSHHLWGLWQWPFYHYPNALIIFEGYGSGPSTTIPMLLLSFEGYGSGPSTTIPMLSSSLRAIAVALLPLSQCSHHLWGLWQWPFYHYPNALIIFEGYGSVPSTTIPMLLSSLRAMAVSLLPLSQCSHHLWGLWQWPFYHYPNALIISEGYGSGPSTTIPMLSSSLRAMAVALLPLSQCSHHLWGLWQWPFYHYPNALIIFEGYGSVPSTTIPMLSSSLRAMAVALLPLSQCSHHLWGLWQWPFYHYPNALIIFEGYGSGPSTTIPMLLLSLGAMAVSLLPLSQCSHHLWGLWQWPFYHYPNALIIFEGYCSGPSTTIPMLSSSLRAMAVALLPLSQCSYHLWGLWQCPFYHYPNALIIFEGYGSVPSTTIPMLSSSLRAMAVALLPLSQCSYHLWGLWQCPFYHYPNALIIFEGYGSGPSTTIPMLLLSLGAMAVSLLPLSQCSHHLWGLWQWPFYHYPNALIIFEGYGSNPSTTIPMLSSSLRAMAVTLLPLSQCSHHLWGLWQCPFYHYPNALIIFEGYGSGPSTTIPMLLSSLRAMAVVPLLRTRFIRGGLDLCC